MRQLEPDRQKLFTEASPCGSVRGGSVLGDGQVAGAEDRVTPALSGGVNVSAPRPGGRALD
ncbi:hypothetical protein SHO565_55930 [Streptomyces sp. HO565]